MDKRTFLKTLSAVGVGTSPLFACVTRMVASVEGVPDEAVATDDAFWAEVRGRYRLKPDVINLENGYFCMMPEEILEAYVGHVRTVNLHASWYMRRQLADDRRTVVQKLADLAGCPPAELAITRNTTESLDLVIGGIHWEPGDEAVMAEQDYGAMLDMFALQADRHGIVNRRVMIPNHPKNDEEIVDVYASAITDKTRLLMVCQMVNITGQVLPVKKICDMAHASGVEVMVDGAHGFAHIDSNIPALGADYYGASLHKWLSAPMGCGLLWIAKDKIPGLWPLMAESPREPGDIARLNHMGTTPPHVHLGILDAIEFHTRLGPRRKEARLRYLQRYWTSRARELRGVVVNTPADPARHCAIGNVAVDGVEPQELAQRLLDDHAIWTVAIDRPGVRGCRITPNLFTTVAELDTFVGALETIARSSA
jgi:selenocysteine lyase/cysteine desulfurase